MGSYLSTIIGNTFGISRNASLRPELKSAPLAFPGIAADPFFMAEASPAKSLSHESTVPQMKSVPAKSHGATGITAENAGERQEQEPVRMEEQGKAFVQQGSPVEGRSSLSLGEIETPLPDFQFEPVAERSADEDRTEKADPLKKDTISSAQTEVFISSDKPGNSSFPGVEARYSKRNDIPAAVEPEDSRAVNPGVPAVKIKTVSHVLPLSEAYSGRVLIKEKDVPVTNITPAIPAAKVPEVTPALPSRLVIGSITVEVAEAEPEKLPPQPARERIIIHRQTAGDPFPGNEASLKVKYGLGQL
jgi:hypothetical protein